ncbi:hypothetical protein SLH33_12945, partial [Tenacibaculum sp. IB213877]|nr:hypothetical protein [Tenacibaculum sp. IB213877]
MSIDKTSFDCSNIGDNTVTLTVTDNNGNSATNTTTVTIEDTIAPVVNCVAPFSLSLDDAGNATITVNDINNGSTDNCGIASMSIDKTSFDCATIGDNIVTLTVTDNNGNSATNTTTVTIEDVIAPVVNCVTPFSIQLDAAGNATLTVNDINNGSTDNCGIASMSIDKTSFDCATIGDNIVTLTVTDVNGNSATNTTTLTIEDVIAPVVNCVTPFSIQLDAAGNATLTVNDINNGSTDNCGIASMSIDKTSFDCATIGDNIVTLTVTDVNGNSATNTTTLTIEDVIAPVVNCVTPFSIQLDAAGNATLTVSDINNGSTDNC